MRAWTYTSGKREFKIIGAEGVIVDCDIDDFVEKVRFAEEVLGDPEPKSKRLMVYH